MGVSTNMLAEYFQDQKKTKYPKVMKQSRPFMCQAGAKDVH